MVNINLPRLYIVGPMTGQIPGSLPTQGEQLAQHLQAEGFMVRQVSAHPNRYVRLLEIATKLISQSKAFDIAILQVYSGQSFVLSDVASLICKITGKRTILVLHGGNLPAFSRNHTHWVHRVFSRAHDIIAPSNYLLSQLGWLGYPIKVIPNSLDIAIYPFRHRGEVRPNLLWMRSFEDIYHPEMAMRVLAELTSPFPEAKLTMAGPDRGALPGVKKLAADLGLSDRVYFPGFLDSAGKTQAAQTHDIYLNTNRIDNMPVTVLEMGAYGLPVVATQVGGIPYLLKDNENALLVPDGDHQAMAQAVLYLIENPSLASALSRSGRALAESCAWEAVREQWQAVLRANPTNP